MAMLSVFYAALLPYLRQIVATPLTSEFIRESIRLVVYYTDSNDQILNKPGSGGAAVAE